jgi:hypothetical protein
MVLTDRNMEDRAWHELQTKMKETKCTTNMGTLAVLLNSETMCVGGVTEITTNEEPTSCAKHHEKDEFCKSFASRLSSSLGRVVQRTQCAASTQQQSSDNLRPNRSNSLRPPSMTSQASVNGLLSPPSTSPIIRRMQSFIMPRRSNERVKEDSTRQLVHSQQNLAAVSLFEGSEEFLLDPKSTRTLPSDDCEARTNASRHDLQRTEHVLDSLECTQGQWPSRFSMHGDLF